MFGNTIVFDSSGRSLYPTILMTNFDLDITSNECILFFYTRFLKFMLNLPIASSGFYPNIGIKIGGWKHSLCQNDCDGQSNQRRLALLLLFTEAKCELQHETSVLLVKM